MSTIKIDLSQRVGTVDRKIYGNFIEHLGRCIYGGIYEPGSPLSDERGFRKDALEAVRALKVPILRWPGGNFVSGYHWMDGVGPKESRPKRRELAWHAVESNQFGTNEFIEYCRLIDTEPYICVNMGSGTQDEAANWVEYCNGTGDTEFANLRRSHGYEQPHKVKYWGLGNEVYGDWQIGHKSAQDYAKAAREFGKVMKWTDPDIELVACGAQHLEWDVEVLDHTADLVQYIAAHYYWGPTPGEDPYYSTLTKPANFEEYLRILWQLICDTRRKRGIRHEIKIALDEWNVWYRTGGNTEEVLQERYDLTDALAVAIFLNMMRRNCHAIEIANLAQLVNVIAPIFTSPEGLFRQTIYFPLQAAVDYSGGIALNAWVDCETCEAPGNLARTQPLLDVFASLDEAAGKLFISAVNLKKDEPQEVRVKIDSARVGPEGVAHIVNGPSAETVNDFGAEQVAMIHETFAASADFIYTLPAHSAAVLEVDLG
jgi:alpha-N-arabinofuranosidase